jgi:hypothetical protein
LQGFTGRAATTTIHDATETGLSISGTFQAAEDFAVLGWWNAYDYFNHLRLKHLPKTDLCSHLAGTKFHKLDMKTFTFAVKKGFFRTPGLPPRVEATVDHVHWKRCRQFFDPGHTGSSSTRRIGTSLSAKTGRSW